MQGAGCRSEFHLSVVGIALIHVHNVGHLSMHIVNVCDRRRMDRKSPRFPRVTTSPYIFAINTLARAKMEETFKASDTQGNQPMPWPVPYACAVMEDIETTTINLTAFYVFVLLFHTYMT